MYFWHKSTCLRVNISNQCICSEQIMFSFQVQNYWNNGNWEEKKNTYQKKKRKWLHKIETQNMTFSLLKIGPDLKNVHIRLVEVIVTIRVTRCLFSRSVCSRYSLNTQKSYISQQPHSLADGDQLKRKLLLLVNTLIGNICFELSWYSLMKCDVAIVAHFFCVEFCVYVS